MGQKLLDLFFRDPALLFLIINGTAKPGSRIQQKCIGIQIIEFYEFFVSAAPAIKLYTIKIG